MTQVQQRARVGGKELAAMTILIATAHTFLNYPLFAFRSGMEAAWMEPLIAAPVTIGLFLVMDSLLRRHFPGQDLLDVARHVFGVTGFAVVGLLIVGYLLVLVSLVMREFVENVLTAVLPSTPIVLVTGLFIFTSGYIAYCGLEGIARTSYFVLPILLLGIGGLCVLTVNWWQPPLLLPFWGSGVRTLLTGGWYTSSIFVNVLILCLLYPHVHQPRDVRFAGVVGVVIPTVLMSSFLAVYLMVFSASDAPNSAFPLYQLSRIIYIGRFIQRLESLFVFLWVTAAVIKLASMLWAITYILSKLAKWPTFRPAVPAVAVLAVAVSMWPQHLSDLMAWDEKYFLPWGWTLNFGLPLVILFFGLIRGRRPPLAKDRR